MLQPILANLVGFLTFQSIPTIVYLVINYRLLNNMLAPQKISKCFYVATIVPILVLVALYFSHDIDKAGKWIGLALLIYGAEYLGIVAALHAVILPLTRKFRGNKNIWIGNVIAANGIAYLVAMLAMWISLIGLAAIVSFFNV